MQGKESDNYKADKRKLLVFFGMVAAGKSFLAREWAARRGCSYHNTDVVRKDLAGFASESRQRVGIDQGMYSAEYSRCTYRELIRRVKVDLEHTAKQCTVCDGSYRDEKERQRVVAAFSGWCRIYFIYCHCSESVVRSRLAQRAEDLHAVSDGSYHIYLMQKKTFLIPKVIKGADLFQLNTEQPIDDLVEAVDTFVGWGCG